MHDDSRLLELPLRQVGALSPQRRNRPASPNSTSSASRHSARLVTAIQLGHTRCLLQYLEDLVGRSNRRRTSSPTANCGSVILDRREIPPKHEYDWVTVQKVLYYTSQGTSQAVEFEQASSPLIWAVDCHEWSCLRLMCNFHADDLCDEASGGDGCLPKSGIVYNPSHPQPVKRRITNFSVNDRSPYRTNNNDAFCCNHVHSQNDNLSGEVDADGRACLNQGLRPLANVMLSVSFTNLCSINNTADTGNLSRASMSVRSSPRREVPETPLPKINGDSRVVNSVSLLGCGSKFSSRQLKRVMPYRNFWVRGSFTYQSLLDYFIAVGYETVGTYCDDSNSIRPGCEHCKTDREYSDYPNYPIGPKDVRNETFLNHFRQLDVMLGASGVSVNRLDSVIAFNALAVSAGRRLAGWCCHGIDGDVTVNENPAEPLIEWRILATLIDHGMDEFEWLEFLSPQQNLIGQALCVLAWPMCGGSSMDSATCSAQRSFRSRWSENRRTRRRSSSPLKDTRPMHGLCSLPDLGSALKRQAFFLLLNLWALGAFSSHHIVRNRRDSGAANYGVRIWDSRPPSQRSHSYTATMDGGDLRRIMLKTISSLPAGTNIEPIGFLRRWTYFQQLWRSALSGTPLPFPPPPEVGSCVPMNTFGGLHSPQNLRRGVPGRASFSDDAFRCAHRSYQPICLRLLARNSVRRCLARSSNLTEPTKTGLVAPGLVGSPSVERFLVYFHSIQQMLGAEIPPGLMQIYMVLCEEDPGIVP